MEDLKRFVIGAGVAVGVLVSVPAMYIILVSFLNIVSPPMATEPRVLEFIGYVSVFIVPGIAASSVFLLQRVRSIPEYALPGTAEAQIRKPIVRNLRIRSRLFKLASAVVLGIMLCIALLGFTIATDVARQRPAESTQTVPLSRVPTTNELQPRESQEGLLSQEVGALLLLVLLLRTLALVYRSNMRLASFYDGRADYLQMGVDPQKLSHEELLKFVTAEQHDPAWTHVLGRSWRRQSELNRHVEGAQRGKESIRD